MTREFCENCGTHIATRRPGLPFVILKVGTLDDPSLYGGPQMAIYTIDSQPFHLIAEGLPAFERRARRAERSPRASRSEPLGLAHHVV